MSNFDEIAWLDATAQAELIRNKEVSSLEMVEAAIERIERLNPQLNAIVTPMYDLARQAARGDIPDGPFTGVPFLLKDLLATYEGVRMTAGASILQNFIAPRDSELTARCKRAGLITIAKTNTPEFGLLPVTEPKLFGPARNPWDARRTPGGSSGGSASAVAAGITAMAHGNDGGGSIRIPASCCGIFGLKPTRARNSLGPGFGDQMGGLVVEHALTRSVRDSASLLDATHGPLSGDPYAAPAPQRPFIEEVGADPGSLRIGLTTKRASGGDVHPDCIQAAQAAAKLCEELGHKVEIAAPAVGLQEHLPYVFTALWTVGLAATIDGIAKGMGQPPREEHYEPLTWALYQQGNKFSGADYLLALDTAQKAARQYCAFFTEYDLLLTPTLAKPPVEVGALDSPPDDPLKGWRESAKFSPLTAIANLTGQPAMSVPLHWNQDNLPIGVQFIGRFGDEAALFRLASQLEKASPWAQRRPEVSCHG